MRCFAITTALIRCFIQSAVGLSSSSDTKNTSGVWPGVVVIQVRKYPVELKKDGSPTQSSVAPDQLQ